MTEEFQKFTKKLINWRANLSMPKASDYPDKIILNQTIIDSFRKIKKNTKFNSSPWFKKNLDEFGMEYSATLFYFGGQLLFTNPVSRNFGSVNVEVNISKITHEIDVEKKQINFEFTVGESSYRTAKFPLEQWLRDSKADQNIAPVAVLHICSKNSACEDKYLNTFFSEADLRVLSIKGIYITFKISEDSIWLAAKTNKYTQIPISALNKALEEELFAANQNLNRTNALLSSIVEHFSESGLLFYHGKFNKFLKKISIENYRREIESYHNQKQKLNIKKAELLNDDTFVLQHKYDTNEILSSFQLEEPKPVPITTINQKRLQEIKMKNNRLKKVNFDFVVSLILIILTTIGTIMFVLFFL